MLTIEKLKVYGADTAKGLSRCANNEALYLRLVDITVRELSSGSLGEALASGDPKRAFEAAHKLKGSVSNLALTPIEVPLSELTELLRSRTPGDHTALYDEIVRKTNELASL